MLVSVHLIGKRADPGPSPQVLDHADRHLVIDTWIVGEHNDGHLATQFDRDPCPIPSAAPMTMATWSCKTPEGIDVSDIAIPFACTVYRCNMMREANDPLLPY